MFTEHRSAGSREPVDSRSRLTLTSLPLGLDFVAEHRVAAVQGTQVALDGQLAVHHRILGLQIRLVEVVRMLHVGRSQTCSTAKTQHPFGSGFLNPLWFMAELQL